MNGVGSKRFRKTLGHGRAEVPQCFGRSKGFHIDGTAVDAQWENNAAVTELYALAQNAITVNTSAYGGFEQVGSLPQSFSRSDAQMTAQPGDIVLYSGNQLVVFSGSNTWSYTKLGHIKDLSADELAVLLDKEQTVIELQLKSK